MIITAIVFVVLLVPSFSYGTWREQPLEELWEQSQTIFVGNVTSVQTIDVEKTIRYSEETDGVEKNMIENYTLHLDEYTVKISSFFKNPQNFDTITVREPTVSAGIYQSTIAGYEIGDNVLFYLKNIDGTNTYSPESQKIEIDNHLYYFQDEFKKLSEQHKNSISHIGTIQWLEASYSSSETAVVRVIDPDMDLDPEKIDNFDVFVWSDSDTKGIVETVNETGLSTGIFENAIYLTPNDDGCCIRLQVKEGDFITAQYDDRTLPVSYTEGSLSIITKSEIRPTLESPLKQYEMGVRYHDIQCKDGLELVGKLTTGTPACVKSQSVKELVYRGWATSDKIYPLANPQTYMLATNEETFSIEYSIDGSTISEIIYDKDSNSLVIQLEDTVGGNLTISIPRDVIDATFGNNDDDEFFVLIDGVEVAFGEISDEQERTLTMLLPRESSIIEIIGTYLI